MQHRDRAGTAGMESLEGRTLLSSIAFAGGWASLSSRGVLQLQGTSAGDQVTVAAQGSNLLVTRGSASFRVAAASVKAISANLGGGNDVFRSSLALPMHIIGGAGNDTITTGGGGNDTIEGGAGNDRMIAGAGNDRIYGGAGNDQLDGGEGDDSLYGEDGDDRLDGGEGRNTVVGGGGHNSVAATPVTPSTSTIATNIIKSTSGSTTDSILPYSDGTYAVTGGTLTLSQGNTAGNCVTINGSNSFAGTGTLISATLNCSTNIQYTNSTAVLPLDGSALAVTLANGTLTLSGGINTGTLTLDGSKLIVWVGANGTLCYNSGTGTRLADLQLSSLDTGAKVQVDVTAMGDVQTSPALPSWLREALQAYQASGADTLDYATDWITLGSSATIHRTTLQITREGNLVTLAVTGQALVITSQDSSEPA